MKKACLWALLALRTAAYSQTHLVDLQKVACRYSWQGARDYIDIELDQTALEAAKWQPHVVTFHRSSSATTAVIFALVNGDNKMWGAGLLRSTLARQTSRRLQDNVDFEELDEEFEELDEPVQRRLETSQARQTAPAKYDDSVLPNPPRRRTEQPRRRDAPAEAGPRRRSKGVFIQSAPSAGFKSVGTGSSLYSLLTQDRLDELYAGDLAGAVYGPSKIASGDTVSVSIGAGAINTNSSLDNFYLTHRFKTAACTGKDCCYGCDNDCFSSSTTCSVEMTRKHYREDLFEHTGFFPADEGPYPLKIRIYRVDLSGADDDDAMAAICPDNACRIDAQECPEPDANNLVEDLFVTVTAVDLLGDTDPDAANGAFKASMTVVIAFCLALRMCIA